MSNRIRSIWDWTEDLSVRGRLCSLGYPTAAQSSGRSVDDPAEPQLRGRQGAHLCFLQPPPQCSFFRAASTLVFLIGLGEKRSTGFAGRASPRQGRAKPGLLRDERLALVETVSRWHF